MKVVDPLLWNTLRNKAGIDSPGYHQGKSVVLFAEAWCERMEEALQEVGGKFWFSVGATKRERSIPQLDGIELSEVGEAMVLISSNWVHGEQFTETLSPIERKLYVETLQQMIATQQLAAQDITPPQKNLA